jgi:integrase
MQSNHADETYRLNVEVERLFQERNLLQRSSHADLTLKGYAYDWAMFSAWCDRIQRESLPASVETLSLYLTAILTDGRKVATARRRACAVAFYHRRHGQPSPLTSEVYALLSAAERQRREQPREMRAITVPQLRQMSTRLADLGTPLALRDRAILVVGFASALRRSNLAALNLHDIEFTCQGFIIHVRFEKQDQRGVGRMIGVPQGKDANTCPVKCLEAWLQHRGNTPGSLFQRLNRHRRGEPMDGMTIQRVVKKSVAGIGLDPKDRYSAHSLRAGFVTAAAEGGASEFLVAAQTGHRSFAVLRKYFRRVELFKANACFAIEL